LKQAPFTEAKKIRTISIQIRISIWAFALLSENLFMIFKESVLKRFCLIQIFFLSAFIISAGLVQAQQIPQNQVVQNRLSELLLDADSAIFTGFRSQNWLELERT
jgi:hypothetical protein